MDGNNPRPPVKPVRKWTKQPAPLPIPSLPTLASAGPSSTPVTPALPPVSTQVPLRAPKRTQYQKIDDFIRTNGFPTLGDFLMALFQHRIRGEKDYRTRRHRQAVSAFLRGCSTIKMANFIPLLYNHPQSRPKRNDLQARSAAFSPYKPLHEILYAQPCLSSWATRLIGDHTYFRVGKLARKDPGRRRRHLRATTNGRVEDVEALEWEDVEFTMGDLAEQYKVEDEFMWYLTECCTGSWKNGKVIIKKTRPHPIIQVGAISSFILSRNKYASGDLGLPLGIWLFACRAHVDIKRVFCRFGYSVSDSTARNALDTLTESSLAALREQVRDAAQRGEVEWGKVLDNVQSIDWTHIHDITHSHFVRVVVNYHPRLNHLSAQVSEHFRTTLAKHRLPPIKKALQPLPTNSEREVENKGMQNGLFDFDNMMGVERDRWDNLLLWNRGDGASHATMMRLQRILATTPNIYHSLRNVVSTPEWWHTKATDLNSCASNHYGPAASKDPSSLSRSSNATNMKRPSNLKKCDFYPTSRSMNMMWEARVLDCWRLVLGCDSDLLTYFDELADDALPTLNNLLEKASIIRERYACQTAYEQSLDQEEQDDAPPRTKFASGTPWTPPSAPEDPYYRRRRHRPSSAEPTQEFPDSVDPEAAKPNSHADQDGPKTHKEPPGFNGDRIFIFTFAGTSNHNYTGYMLDLYTLLQFEAFPDLREGLLNNYLFNLRGEFGTFVEGDLMQEWNSKWLEDMASRRGGEFDEKFYRTTISPNVLHFLKMKEDSSLLSNLNAGASPTPPLIFAMK
ncbi:hypothetical protein B0H17DRAFT_1151772 [Mycena rosella]|uniref:DUF6589 domain-containing protein n=1 Tax=Mycena rosella TaxID=1033263 RepID=A0AAD7BHY3_MYCRO|nr:hypothetical protein B0H17DRAFT_1151772 [Mycena rosella]